ncbi:hypothetical protein ACQ4LE_009913 [Meloidogyne hapla]|uniref:CCDC66 domain-containing protein n=1 Tax=Meloidogyne hapla TaxID=6305 RepID=A0A1I8BB10_MELHA
MAQISFSHQTSKQKQQRITQLPGENGFHARDGSLIRKKREQWEIEKAEANQNSWFPFGDRRNKKNESNKSVKYQKEMVDDDKFRNDEQTNNFKIETIPTTDTCQQPHFLTTTNNHQNNNTPQPQSPINICQPTMLPFFVDYSLTGHFHTQQQFIPSQQQNIFPNNFIPIQPSNNYQNPMPLTFSGPTTTFMDPLFLPQKMPIPLLQTPPYSISSSESANSSSKDAAISTPSNEINNYNSNEELQKQQKNSPNIYWQKELDKQVKEKKMAEMIEAEKLLVEQKILEKEAKLKFEREEKERAAEEQKRTQKIEIRDQCNQACMDGLQQAHKEAEALKRAKLYRHILLDGQADLETSKQVLKIDDDQLVVNVLRQLRDFELQKSIEKSESKLKTNSPSSTKSPKQQNSSPNSTPKTIKNNSKQQPFSRANSWSVKQSRTLPTQWASHLPIPTYQKHFKQHENNNITQSTYSKPSNNEICNKNKEKTPPGLFEQLTLRRPRNQQIISSSKNKEIKSNMILAKPEENIEINILNFNEEQNKLKQNNNSTNNNLNSLEVYNQNSNNSKNNLIMKQDTCKVPHSTTVIGKPNDNGSTSTQSSNSPGSSSSTTSRESANVFKFRTLLSTPSGSQDDLFNNLNNNSTTISIPRTIKTKNNNCSISITSPAPSPFSRKNSNEVVNLNNECFGIRQSLRSPTMRRLQESLQSLSTIDDENEITLENNKSNNNIKSRSCTPKPFNCKNSQYRSFNMRRDNTARSRQILEHLAAVRAQLKNSQAQLEKTISKQNLADN